MEPLITITLAGVAMGVAARLVLLKIDYRQYPSYPHGLVSHLFLGMIASFLGALAVPALVAKEFTAVTFLVLAAQQFREVRNMERETLHRLDQSELVPRGDEYIEGIARVFEARNYLAMMVALVTGSVGQLVGWIWGIIAGAITVILIMNFRHDQVVGQIARVEPAAITFQGALLEINGIILTNVGLASARAKILQDGLAVVIHPVDDDARSTLDGLGQRQAILHTAASLLGTKREVGEQEWAPLARKNIDEGSMVIFLVPNEPDLEMLIAAVQRAPVLESARRNPLSSKIGRKAAD